MSVDYSSQFSQITMKVCQPTSWTSISLDGWVLDSPNRLRWLHRLRPNQNPLKNWGWMGNFCIYLLRSTCVPNNNYHAVLILRVHCPDEILTSIYFNCTKRPTCILLLWRETRFIQCPHPSACQALLKPSLDSPHRPQTSLCWRAIHQIRWHWEESTTYDKENGDPLLGHLNCIRAS